MAWKVRLTWQEGATDQQGDGFKIYRSVDGGSYSLVATLPITQTSWDDTNVSAGHKYSYQVKEYKGSDVSPAATVTAYLPAAPGSCSASYVSDSQINVSWSNVSYETGYELQRQVDGGSWSTIANKGAGVTSHSDTGTSANHRYRYRVRAKGTGSYVSDWRYSDYVYTTPAAPSGCTAHYVATDKAYCTWTDNSAYEQQFRVEYRINDGSWTFLENAAAGATSSSQVNVGANKKIEFRVRAERTSPDALQSAYSTSGIIYTTPAAPSNLQLIWVEPGSQLQLTITDNAAYEQNIEFELEIDGEWQGAVVEPANTTTKTWNVSGFHRYRARARATRSSPDALQSAWTTSGEAAMLGATDVGQGAETPVLRVGATDVGQGAETPVLNASLAAGDIGSGIDFAQPFPTLLDIDVGHGIDISALAEVVLMPIDSGQGTETAMQIFQDFVGLQA